MLCTQPLDVAGLPPCSHEEAGTRIHVEDAVRRDYTKVSIRTVDTDVVILAVTATDCLDIDEFCVAFATGKSFRFLTAHEMAVALEPNKCRGLPFFHALTVCDTVSSFGGRGKKTAWDTWKACDDVYDRTNIHEHVNEARKHLFTRNGRSIDALPLTREALIQHTKRAAYQAGFI